MDVKAFALTPPFFLLPLLEGTGTPQTGGQKLEAMNAQGGSLQRAWVPNKSLCVGNWNIQKEKVCVCVSVCPSLAHNPPGTFKPTQHKIHCSSSGLQDPFSCFMFISSLLFSTLTSLLFYKHSKKIFCSGAVSLFFLL